MLTPEKKMSDLNRERKKDYVKNYHYRRKNC